MPSISPTKKVSLFVICICSILASYPLWPTQTAWVPVYQTSTQNPNTPISAALTQDGYGAFDIEPYFQLPTTISVNMTYIGTASGGGQVPEVCILTAWSIKHFDPSKTLRQQTLDCSQTYLFNSTTNQYTAHFQENLPGGDNYLFIWRIVSSAGVTYLFNSITPTLTISEAQSIRPLQSFVPESQVQTFSLANTLLAVILSLILALTSRS